ncbi:unnamed protein product, partial [Iphiclides podalirius]
MLKSPSNFTMLMHLWNTCERKGARCACALTLRAASGLAGAEAGARIYSARRGLRLGSFRAQGAPMAARAFYT